MQTLFEQRPGKFIQRPGVDAVLVGDDPALQVVNQGQKRNIFVYGEKQLQAFGGFVVGAGADQPYDFGQGFDIPFIRGHVIQGNAVVSAVSKAEGLRMVSFRTGQGKVPGQRSVTLNCAADALIQR